VKKCLATFALLLTTLPVLADTIKWEGREFTIKNVHASIEKLNEKAVLKVERDLTALPFDLQRVSETVDEPTFVRLQGLTFKEGTIEVKVLSRLLPNAPDFARGFIGIAFHINERNSEFEGIYIRPTNGRTDDAKRRKNATQYFSYPNFKFDRLRKDFPGKYESPANIGLNEWIQLKIEVKDKRATLFINNSPAPALVVDSLNQSVITEGAIGLWVDIGTEGYFSDLRISH
jgi:hypothetical protein